jgi:hypothetical protein
MSPPPTLSSQTLPFATTKAAGAAATRWSLARSTPAMARSPLSRRAAEENRRRSKGPER